MTASRRDLRKVGGLFIQKHLEILRYVCVEDAFQCRD